MTQIIAKLAEISDNYDAVFCDLWGCLHNGVAPFPDAVAALQAFRAKGGRAIGAGADQTIGGFQIILRHQFAPRISAPASITARMILS